MRRPKLERGQEIEFQKMPGLTGPRYKGKVKQVTGDAVEINVTDDRWTSERTTIVRLRDVIDPTTGQRFAYKNLPTPAQAVAAQSTTPVEPAPPPPMGPATPPTAQTEPTAAPIEEESSDSGPIFGKNDLDAWLSMGKDLLTNIDSMIEDKKGSILLIENQMKELVDQRNAALNDIKEMEAKKLLLADFYKEKKR